jgi:hypothetical protein
VENEIPKVYTGFEQNLKRSRDEFSVAYLLGGKGGKLGGKLGGKSGQHPCFAGQLQES